MRFLDWLFKKRGKKEEPTAEVAETRMSLSEAKNFLEKEKEAVFTEIYPKSKQLTEEIKTSLAELRRVANDFSLKQVDPGSQYYKIATQMKTNFAERTKNALNSLAYPQEINWRELKRFHAQLHHTLFLVTKTSSDNRYLAVFFKNEFNELASIMKQLGALSDELRQEIDSKEKEARKLDEFIKEIDEIQAKENKKNLLEREVKELEEEEKGLVEQKKALEEREGWGAGLDAEKQAKELKAVEEKIVLTQEKILGYLNPLTRSLRKLEKILLDKQEAALAASYCRNPVEALLQEPRGQPGLKKLLGKLRSELGKGFLEESWKEREKILKTANDVSEGCLEPLIEEIRELGGEKKRMQSLLEEARETIGKLKEVEKKIVEVGGKREKVVGEVKQLQESIGKRVFSLQEKIFRATEKNIAVMAS